nr:hypothetical protein [uncultured Halomonas sp.]
MAVYPKRSIIAVSERCSFTDTVHFSRNVKESFGYTLAEIRKGDAVLQQELVDPVFLHIGKLDG